MTEIQKQIQAQAEQRIRHKLAVGFANRVVLELGIPEGNFLSDYLGVLNATNNREAILHWILRQDEYNLKLEEDKKVLKVKLHRLLMDFESEKEMLFP